MANTQRETAGHLNAQDVLQDAHNYAFYRLIEHLYSLHGENVEDMGASHIATPQRIILEGDAGLGFPASDVVEASEIPDSNGMYRIKTSFFSLQGPDSPLPGFYLDQLAHDYAHNIGIRPAFFDFFNNRLLTLLNHAWRKYKYYKRFQHEAKDHFSKYIFSLIGLNNENLRQEHSIPWSRLLSFAGIIASRSRSPSVVSGIIGHCFDLESVAVREFEQRYVDVSNAQKNSLGQRNMSLSNDFILGARISTRSSKFSIIISELTQQKFRDFLPNGANFQPLKQLINFLLRDSMAYDLELGLKQEEIPPFQLAKNSGTYIGWTSFLPQDAPLRLESTVKIRARS
ncbi:MAG: type VI secretion system baseplate subunit TssG [Saezia sp.]